MCPERMSRVVAVGRFDGVHRGHQFLLREARCRAAGGGVVAYTFPPRGPSLLTREAKERLLRGYADEVLVVPWESVQGMEAEDFVREELVGRCGAEAIVVGPDHRFGKGRVGDVETLRRLAPSLGFEVHVVDPLHMGGDAVSAARIRDLIASGRVEEAASLLDRPAWEVGRPTPGAGLARKLGFPTVNLVLAPELVRPRPGVYAAWAQWHVGEGKALFYIGDRPTFPELPPSVEVHLFVSPSGQVEGPVEVHLIGFIRSDQRFPGERALAAQVSRDREQAEEILLRAPVPVRLLPEGELRTRGGVP